jgi:hypothetical protein
MHLGHQLLTASGLKMGQCGTKSRQTDRTNWKLVTNQHAKDRTRWLDRPTVLTPTGIEELLMGSGERRVLGHRDRFEENIERHIIERTWGRLRDLRVEERQGRMVVHGYAPSYYVKQLALQAAQEACRTIPVEQDIRVGR